MRRSRRAPMGPPRPLRLLGIFYLLCAATWAHGASIPLEEGLEVPPFLLHLTDSEAILCWITPTATRSKLTLKALDGEQVTSETSPSRYHRMELRSLSPGRLYRYDIDDLYTGTFTTPLGHGKYSVAAIGHTHGSETLRHYPDSLLVATVRNIQPDLVIHSGDITYHPTASEFNEHYFRLFRPLIQQTPVYVAAGNHDSNFPRGKNNFRVFRQLFPYDYGDKRGAYYSFTYRNAKFIALSYTTLAFGEDPPQSRWLERELKSSDSTFNIIFMGGGDHTGGRLSQLFALLARHRVDLVLGGDGAGARDREILGIPYFFTGTAEASPHSLRYIEIDDYFLTIKSLNAQGKMSSELTVINTRKKTQVVRDLLDPRWSPAGTSNENLKLDFADLSPGEDGARIAFEKLNVEPESFDAVSVAFKCEGKGRGNIRLYWRAARSRTLFRLQSVAVVAGQMHRYLLKIPKTEPFEGKKFRLTELRLHADSGSKDISATLEEFSLVKFHVTP